jgi:hypothetical protein
MPLLLAESTRMNFLKKLTTPGFHVVGYGQGVVTFQCSKSFKLESTVDGLATLPGGVRCDLTVVIKNYVANGYSAAVVGPPNSLVLLEKIFLPTGGSKEQMFYKPADDSMTRHARTYAVRCRDFKDFKGVTAEVSRAGALVVLSGTIAEGKEISIQIDLDDTDLDPLTIDATVDWCSQRDEKNWIASLNFKPLSPATDAIMTAFLEDLKYRVPGSKPRPEPTV